MSLPFEIRILTSDNMEDAYFLYKKVGRGNFSRDMFFKKYQTQYTGTLQASQLAYIDNKPIGFYGAIPFFVNYRGHQYLAAEVCDSFTLPKFRKQKVNYHLAAACYELLKHQGFSFAFGFQNQGSYFAAKKHNWEIADKMLFRFHIPVSKSGISKYINKVKSKFAYDKLFQNKFGKYLAERSIANQLESADSITLNYQNGFIDYKTFTKNYFIEIGSTKFWINLKSYLEIGCLYYMNQGELLRSLVQLQTLAKQLPVSEIIINTPFNSDLYKILTTEYETHPSWTIGYLNFDHKLNPQKLMVNGCDFDTY